MPIISLSNLDEENIKEILYKLWLRLKIDNPT
jgi:hypothetical protein